MSVVGRHNLNDAHKIIHVERESHSVREVGSRIG